MKLEEWLARLAHHRVFWGYEEDVDVDMIAGVLQLCFEIFSNEMAEDREGMFAREAELVDFLENYILQEEEEEERSILSSQPIAALDEGPVDEGLEILAARITKFVEEIRTHKELLPYEAETLFSVYAGYLIEKASVAGPFLKRIISESGGEKAASYLAFVRWRRKLEHMITSLLNNMRSKGGLSDPGRW